MVWVGLPSLALVLALLLVSMVLMLPSQPAPPEPSLPLSPSGPVAVTAQTTQSDLSGKMPAPSADSTSTPARNPVAPRASATTLPRTASGEAEVCGLGTVRMDDEAPLPQQHIPGGVRALALQRLSLAMAASRDERLRAAEKLLRTRLAIAPEALAGAADADAACRRARDSGLEETARYCVEDQSRRQAELLEPAAAAIDQLARSAALSGDPQIYAFAFEACSPGGLSFVGREGNCKLIDAAAWARLAPGDAEPWLRIAAQALASGDDGAASVALARAGDAQAIGAHAGAPLALAAAALPEGMPALEQTAVLATFGELDAGVVPLGLDVIDTACAEPALRDPARARACDAVARMLVERGRLSAAVTAGVQLGERLGWPAERTGAVLREQRAALDAALRYTAAPQSLGCDSLQRRRELVLLTGRFGDVGAGRELLRRERTAKRVARGP
jgi:hypothetical protein